MGGPEQSYGVILETWTLFSLFNNSWSLGSLIKSKLNMPRSLSLIFFILGKQQ